MYVSVRNWIQPERESLFSPTVTGRLVRAPAALMVENSNQAVQRNRQEADTEPHTLLR